jgi:medium-chain acyl-[acyl-carrier-protein] hydrolase
MKTANANRWIVQHRPNPHCSLRLFCFPFAGGGAQTFRTWHESLPPSVEVCVVQPPGRETRMRETPFSSVFPMVEALAPAIIPFLDKPFVFFGHSMGAILAFELARQLRREKRPLPECLIVSARVAPQVPIPRAPIHNLPQAEFIAGLKALNGTPKEVLEDESLMGLITPLLKADLAVHEAYAYQAELPLACDIFAFGGLQDAEAGREAVLAWREQTARKFLVRMVPGDHFFINSAQALFLRMLSSELYQIIGNAKPRDHATQELAV